MIGDWSSNDVDDRESIGELDDDDARTGCAVALST
jgi:hypothetical protein